MPRAREKVPQIGFWDADVSRPDHDAVCLWVYENAEWILERAFPAFCRDWRDDDVDCRPTAAQEEALAKARIEHPRPRPRIVSRELEFVLQRDPEWRGTPQIVGYADLLIRLEVPVLVFDESEQGYRICWHQPARARVLVEVKSVLPTLGELMRQLNLYRTAHHGPVLVVSPDARYAAVLQEQGIAFAASPARLPAAAASIT